MPRLRRLLLEDREVNAFGLERLSSPTRVAGEPTGCGIPCADADAVARRKLLDRAYTLVGACEALLGESDPHDSGFLAAQTARIQEHPTATGDLGVGPGIAVVGGVEQVPGERVERPFDRGIDAAATARRRRRVFVLEAAGDGEPGLPGRWRRAVDHRRAERSAIRESAHAEETPRKKRRLACEAEFALVDHGTNQSADQRQDDHPQARPLPVGRTDRGGGTNPLCGSIRSSRKEHPMSRLRRLLLTLAVAAITVMASATVALAGITARGVD
jgi:hypothetical protein